MPRSKWNVSLALLAIVAWAAPGSPGDGEPKLDEPLPPGAVARFGSARLRTTGTIFALSADGKILHTLAGGRTLGRRDALTGRLLGEVRMNAAPAGALCWFSPDRRSVAAVDSEGVGLYDVETGERKRTVASNDPSGMLVAAYSPDGLNLATSEYETKGGGLGVGRVRLYPVVGGKSKLLAEFPDYANGLAFSPDGKRLYAAVNNHSVRCLETATSKELWKNDHWARHLAVSQDGKVLASDTYQDGPLRLWNAATGEAVATLDAGKRAWSRGVAFSPDGKTVGFVTNDSVQIWDTASKKLLHRFAGAGPDIAFTPDNASVLTLGNVLERWDLKTGKALYPEVRNAGHIGSVRAVAFAPDGRSLASIGSDGTLRVWDRATGEYKQHKVRLGGGCPLAYTPDGHLLTLGEEVGTLSIRQADTGKTITDFAMPQTPRSTTDAIVARLSEDGKTLLSLGHRQMPISGSLGIQLQAPVVAWDAATAKVILEKSIPGPLWDVVTFSPNGRFLTRSGYAELLDVGTGRSRPLAAKSPPPFLSCTFSPDGRWLATLEAGDGDQWQISQALLVYEVLTGRPVARLKCAGCQSIAFSPDGRLLVANHTDALDVWQVLTGQKLLSLPAKGRLTNWAGSRFAESLAFAPDGRTVATGHGDGTILLWNMAPAWKNLAAPKGAIDAAACWKDLADLDPKIAWAAVDRLASDPPAALKLLGDRVKPVTLDTRRVTDWIAELPSPDFKTREAATTELKRVLEAARHLLVEARRTSTSAEAQPRLDEVLDYAPPIPSVDAVRDLRALAVAERIGTKEAEEFLKAMASGAPDAGLTREAKAVAARIRNR